MQASRLFGLDLLRSIAIAQVMFAHGNTFTESMVHANSYRWLILDGVGLFFVLSGYLIGGILLKEIEQKAFDVKALFRFYGRRWLRTLPAYFVVLGLLLFLYFLRHQALPPFWYKYLVFTQNLFSAHPLFFGEAWSLSVEEWFYLLMPLVFFVALHLPVERKSMVLSVILLFIFSVTMYRIYKVSQFDYFAHHQFGEDILKVVVTRLDSIMYGVLAAWIRLYHPKLFYARKISLFLFGLLLLLLNNILFSAFYHTRLQYTVAPIAVMLLLPYLSGLDVKESLITRCIRFISRISYSMYLCNHMFVIRGLLPQLENTFHLNSYPPHVHNTINLFFFWGLTLSLASLLYYGVEKPCLNLRDKWIPSR